MLSTDGNLTGTPTDRSTYDETHSTRRVNHLSVHDYRLPENVEFTPAFPLPSGLSLSVDGTLAGSPTTSGSYTLSIFATDDANRTAARDFSLTVLPPLMATTTTLPRAILGGRYATILSAISGRPPYTWTLSDGSLPSGITLDPTGFQFGSPMAAGLSSLTLTVTDSVGQTASLKATLTVATALAIATTNLPDALVQTPYSATLTTVAGSEPYT
jgi:large repetitive protein